MRRARCGLFNAVIRRRVAQSRADQGRRCLGFWGQSPNSPSLRLARRVRHKVPQRNWCLTPITPPRSNRATQRTGAAGRRIRLAFSLVTFFWRSKRKLLRCRAHILTCNADLARRGETRLMCESKTHRSTNDRYATGRTAPRQCTTRSKLNCPGARIGSTSTGITSFGANLPSSSNFDNGFSMRC